MVICCCLRCLKCLFCFFNIVLMLLGGTMLSLGLWVLFTKGAYVSILQSFFDSFEALLYIFIAVGAFTMFLGIWGSLGLYFGVRFVLLLYIPLLILVALFHFFPGLFVYFKQEKIEEKLTKNILSLIQNYNPTEEANQHKALAWDYVQVQLSCCGWTGPETWQNNTFFQEKAGIYPCSCGNGSVRSKSALGVCRLNTASHKSVANDWPVKKQGCGRLVQKWIRKVADTVFLMSFVIVPCEILGIGLSLYICARRNVYAEGNSGMSQEEDRCR